MTTTFEMPPNELHLGMPHVNHSYRRERLQMRFWIRQVVMWSVWIFAWASFTEQSVARIPEAVPKLVLAHYMVCCSRFGHGATVDELRGEMKEAASYGIDAFVLNVAPWPRYQYYHDVSARMFDAADALNGRFSLVFSFDFVPVDNALSALVEFSNRPSMLRVGSRIVVSTFGSDGNWGRELRAKARERGIEIFLIPYYLYKPDPILSRLDPLGQDMYRARRSIDENPDLDGYFVFLGPIGDSSRAQQFIATFASLAREHGLVSMMGIAPFYRGQGPKNSRIVETDGGLRLQEQWKASIAAGVNWVEIITWNDWTESTYISPASGILWQKDWGYILSHEGYLVLNQYMSKWFKLGSQPEITDEKVIFFYRLHPKTALSNRLDTAAGPSRPLRADTLNDRVFVTSLLKDAATLTLTVGGIEHQFNLSPGLVNVDAPAAIGPVSYTIRRGGSVIEGGTLQENITQDATYGNFNYATQTVSLR